MKYTLIGGPKHGEKIESEHDTARFMELIGYTPLSKNPELVIDEYGNLNDPNIEYDEHVYIKVVDEYMVHNSLVKLDDNESVEDRLNVDFNTLELKDISDNYLDNVYVVKSQNKVIGCVFMMREPIMVTTLKYKPSVYKVIRYVDPDILR